MKLTYKHTLYASYLGYITQAIVNNLAPLLFIIFQKEFDISIERIGLLISLNFGIQIITDLIAARYIDKIGYRISAVAAHIFCTIGLIGMGTLPFLFQDGYIGLLIAIIINAIGGGLIEVLISPIVESLPGDEKASAMSLLHSFYCWGHVAVVLCSTLYFLIIGTNNWMYLPMIWAVIPLINTFLFAKVPLRKLVEDHEKIPLRGLLTKRIFWIFFFLMISAGASEQAMSQWASFFAENGLGVSKTMGDLLGPGTFALLMGLSRAFYGVKGSKIDLKKALTISGLLCVTSYIIAVFSPIPLISLIGCGLCGLSVGIMWPGVFSLSSKYLKGGGTSMFALLALAGDIGCSAGPGLVGFASDGVLKRGLLFAIIFPIMMIIGVLILTKKKN